MLLVWNLVLTALVTNKKDNAPSNQTNTSGIEQSNITDYTTDLTNTIENTRTGVVSVEYTSQNGHELRSGVIFAQENGDTHIFTMSNADIDSISVTLDNGKTLPAELIGRDETTGLTLIKITADFEINPLRLGDSSLIAQGEYDILLGARRPQTNTSPVGFGIVTEPGQQRLPSSNWIAEVLETDIAYNDEFVGGAMLGVGGELNGIVLENNSSEKNGNSYAIGINEVKLIYAQLLEGEIKRASLGVSARNVSSLQAYEKNSLNIALDQVDGILVMNTFGLPENTIMKNDIIISIDENRIGSLSALKELLYTHMPKDEVTVRLIRNGEEMEVQLELQ